MKKEEISGTQKNELREFVIKRYYDGNYNLEDKELIEKFILYINDIKDEEETIRILVSLGIHDDGNNSGNRAEALAEFKRRLVQLDSPSDNKKDDSVPAPVITKKLPLQRMIFGAASVIVPLLVLSGIWWVNRYQPLDSAEFLVNNGKTEQVALPDSSEVWINSGSSLKFSEGENKERIAELSGETFFKVAKDEKKPFRVKTDDLVVVVLGTEFNVEAYKDRSITTVTLTKGSVELSLNDGQKWTLKPNQQFVYNKQTKSGEVVQLSETDALRNADWRNGNLVFDHMTPLEMFRAIERKYDIKVEIDPSILFSNEAFAMKFQPEDSLDFVLENIKMFEDVFDYQIDGKTIKITKPKK